MAFQLSLPEASAAVWVRMVNTTALMTIKSESYVKPVQPGHELINVTDVCFLIEHEASGQRVMFDLGCRKDYWNLPSVIQKRLGDVIPSLKVDKDVSEILQEQSVPLDSITSIIWSHYHWDHAGNVAQYPSKTDLIVGPGFKSASSLHPTYPENPTSPIMASDLANRQLIEIDFSNAPKIGGFPAHDFFGDGSFYLLDTPGHCIGHMCGLARVITNPSTFVFMGGDICHFPGDFRPSRSIPLPDPIPPKVLDQSPFFPIPCPCSLFTSHHPRSPTPDSARTAPWYEVTDHPRAAYIDPPLARQSVRKMQAFDDCPDVLVCIAHDPSLLEVLPVMNGNGDGGRGINEWKERGWKERCHWGWLNQLPRDGKPGREEVVRGFSRDGKKWDRPSQGQWKGGAL